MSAVLALFGVTCAATGTISAWMAKLCCCDKKSSRIEASEVEVSDTEITQDVKDYPKVDTIEFSPSADDNLTIMRKCNEDSL